jgi:SRSO17 transposase
MDQFDRTAEKRLNKYLDEIGVILGNQRRRASFATYVFGILGDGDRKSVEPIAARACADPEKIDALHQRLLHFLVDSNWRDRDVRRAAAEHIITALEEEEPIEAWVIDDTGFLKQGKHSVGVQRQYTGSAGKTTNCQIGVSLVVATNSEQAPIDFELYLPRSWADDPIRRKEARIPEGVPFRTKPELALEMIRRAIEDDWPRGPVLADAAYGDSSAFRKEIRSLNLDYAVAISAKTKVWRVDKIGRRYRDSIAVGDLAAELAEEPGGFRKITWREGTKSPLHARFCRLRVVPFHNDGVTAKKRERVWLLCEWPEGEKAPSKFHLTTLPETMTRRRMVRLIKQRWRIERTYQDLKGELGLDHYEGRRYPGWHHHVSVVLCCYAFVAAECVRRFPPSA